MKRFLSFCLSICLILGSLTILTLLPVAAESTTNTFKCDGGFYTVSTASNSFTYSATASYGNGFLGWYSGDELISTDPVFSSSLSLNPKFDKKNLISYGDFEDTATHTDILSEINGYTIRYDKNNKGTPAIVSTAGLLNTDQTYGDYVLKFTPSQSSATSKPKGLLNIPVTVEKNTDYIWRFSYKFADGITNFSSNTHTLYMSVDGLQNGKIPWSSASNTVKFTMHSQPAGTTTDSNTFKNDWSWGGNANGFTSSYINDNGTNKNEHWQDIYFLFNPQEDPAIFANGGNTGTVYLTLGTASTLTDALYFDNMSVTKAVKNANWTKIDCSEGGTLSSVRYGENFYWYTSSPRGSDSFKNLDTSNTYVPDMYLPVTAVANDGGIWMGWEVDGEKLSKNEKINLPTISEKTYNAKLFNTEVKTDGYGYASMSVSEKGGQTIFNYSAEPYHTNTFVGWYNGDEFISPNTTYTSSTYSELKAVFDGANTLSNSDFERDDDLSFLSNLTNHFSIKEYEDDEGRGNHYLSIKNSKQETTKNAIVMPVSKNTDYTISFDMKINDFAANGWFRSGIAYELNNWSAVASLGSATQTYLNEETGYTLVYNSDGNGRLQPGSGLDAKIYHNQFDADWIHFSVTFNSGSDTRVFKSGNEGTLYLMLYNFNNGIDMMIDNVVFGSAAEVKTYVEGYGSASADKQTALPGETITYTAKAGFGSSFEGWYIGKTRVSQDTVFTTNRYLALTAHFKNYGAVSDAGFENGTTGDFVGRFDDVSFENISTVSGYPVAFESKMLKVTASNKDYLSFYVPAKAEANTKYLIHFSYKVEAETNTRTDIMIGPKNSWSRFTDATFYASSKTYSYSTLGSFGNYYSDNLNKHFGGGFIEMNVIVDTADELIDDKLYIMMGARDGAVFYIDNLSVTKISDISPYMVGATLTTESTKYYNEGTLSFASGLNFISPATVLKEIGTVTMPTQLISADSPLTKENTNTSVAKLRKSTGLYFDEKQFYATFRGTEFFNPNVKLSARSYAIMTDTNGKYEWVFYSENNNEAANIKDGVYNRSISQVRRLLALSLINAFAGAYPEDFYSTDDVEEGDDVRYSASVSSDEAWNFVKRNAYLYGSLGLTRELENEENLFLNGDFEDTSGYLGAIRQNLVKSTGDGLSFSGGNSGNAVWYDYDHKGWVYYSGTDYQLSYGNDHSKYYYYVNSSKTKAHSGDYSLCIDARAGTSSYILYDLEPQTDYEISFWWKGTDTLAIRYTYVYPYIYEFFGYETQKDANDQPIIETIDGVNYRLNKRIDQRYFAPDTLSLYSEAFSFDSAKAYGTNDWQKKTIKFNTDNNTSVVFGINYSSTVNSGLIYIDDMVLKKAEPASEQVRNGDFSDGLSYWKGHASTYKIGGESVATFNKNGQNLWQTLKVDRNSDYTLKVKAKTREIGALKLGVTDVNHQTLNQYNALSNTSMLTTDNTGVYTYTIDFHTTEYDYVNIHLSSLSNTKNHIYSVEVEKAEKSIVYDKIDFEDGVEQITSGVAPLSKIAKTNNLWYSLNHYEAHSGDASLMMKATSSDTNTSTDFTTDDGELLKHPLYQKWSEFQISSGTYYKLSYYAKAKTAGVSYDSSIRYLEQSDWDYTQAADKKTVTLSNTDWTYVEHVFCIDFPIKYNYFANFVVSANNGTTSDIYFDDIVLEETLPLIESGVPEKLYTESIFNLIPDNNFENGANEYSSFGATVINSAFDGNKALRVNAGTRIVIPIKTYVDYNYIPSVEYIFSAAIRKSSGGSGYVGISYTKDGKSFYKKADGTDGSKIFATSTGWNFTGFSYRRETVTPTYLVIECTSGYIDVDMLSLFTHQHAFAENPNIEKSGYDYDNLNGAIANGGSYQSGSTTLSINNKTPASTVFTGLDKTVHQAYVMDCMGREYSQEQIDFEIEMLKKSGISMVRTMFRSEWAYSGNELDPWDWESEEMQQFYAWCNRLAEHDIEVAVIPAASVPGFVHGASSGPDVSFLYPHLLDKNGNSQHTLSWGVLHPAINFPLACERYAEFFTQTIEAMYNHGIKNVTHALTFNEPCHPNGTLYEGAHAALMLRLVETCVDKMNSRVLPNGQTVREYITLVGPNQANRTNAGLADFFLENSKYGIDLYDVWSTHMVVGITGDIVGAEGDNYDWSYSTYTTMMNNYKGKKPFWCDEFAVQGYKWEYDKNSNDSEARWWGVNYSAQYAALINSGMSGGILWQLLDNNWTYLSGSGGEFMYGIHMTGATHSVLQTQTPYYSYYAVSLLTKYLSSREQTTSFAGTSLDAHIHTAAVRLPDGNWSILVVNNNETDEKIAVNLDSSIGGKTMYRHTYVAEEITPDSEAKILDADKTFTNVTTRINDTIPAGSVVVYTTVKG